MARATEPERRLLAVYTGGTIGMRSEGGGKCPGGPAAARPWAQGLSEPDSQPSWSV